MKQTKKENRSFTRVLLRVVVFCVIVCMVGCVDIDASYRAEKLLWQADKKLSALLDEATTQNRQLRQEEVDEMIAVYRKVSDRFPLEQMAARAQFSIAEIYKKIGELDKARKEFKHIVQNFSSSPAASRAQVQIAQTLEQEERFDEAIEAYEKVKDLYPLTPLGLQAPLRIMRFYKQQGDQASERKAYRQAVRHYSDLLNRFDGTSAAGFYHKFIAVVHQAAQEWESAIETWDAIIAAYPDTQFAMSARLAKAEIYVNNLSDIAKGIELYEDFIQRYPQGSGVKNTFLKQARLRVGGLYIASDRAQDAQQIFKSLLQDYPDDKELGIHAHFGLASSFDRLGNEPELLSAYEEIRKIYPDDQRTLSIPLFIYRYYQRTENNEKEHEALEKAIVEYESAFKKHADDPELSTAITRSLLFVYAQTKEWNKLLDFFELLRRKYPNNPTFPFSIANLYRTELNQPQEARRVYQEMLAHYAAYDTLVPLIKEQIDSLPH